MSRTPTNPECFAAFHAASRCIEQAGIRHWIDFGTLLGAVRQGGYIAHDQDVDFNFHGEDLGRLLALRDELARQCSLELFFDPAVNTVRLLPRHPGLRLTSDHEVNRSCIEAGVPYVDFYPCRTDGKWLRHPVPEYDFRSIYSSRLGQILFEGSLFPSPQNPISLLLHRYGPNWAIPLGRTDFDAQAKHLIWPFPDRLGCLLIAPHDVALDLVSQELELLRLDFDHVVALLPSSLHQLAEQSGRWSASPDVRLVQDCLGMITPSLLDTLGCHFVKAIGLPAPELRLGPPLLEADVLLHP